jgi:hypothetical protein
VALSQETADAHDRPVKNLHTNVSTMTVAGAQDVRIVTESYVGNEAGRTSTLFRRTWLTVMLKPGLVMDLVVVNEPERGGTSARSGVERSPLPSLSFAPKPTPALTLPADTRSSA